MKKSITIFYFFCINISYGYIDTVFINPGKGIVTSKGEINIGQDMNDIEQLLEIQKTDESIISIRSWSGINKKNNQPIGGRDVFKTIRLWGIELEFYQTDSTHFSLKNIIIESGVDSILYIVNSELFIGKENPKIKKYFKPRYKIDYISKKNGQYSFYSQGIQFFCDPWGIKSIEIQKAQ